MTRPSIEDNCCDTYLQLSLARILSKIPKRIMCFEAKVFHLYKVVVAHLITPPSCFTFIRPVLFDSKAAKAFLNLKILSADMKSAILTPSNGAINVKVFVSEIL